MTDQWEETKARLEAATAGRRIYQGTLDELATDIRAALQRVQELERALQETRKNWGKTSHYLRTVLAEIVRLRERVEELERDRDSLRQDRDAFSENLGRAQERVADLEREVRIAVAGESHWERAEAAEARVQEMERERGIIQNEAEENKLEWYAAVKSMRSALSRAEAAEAKLARCVEAGTHLQHEARQVAIPGRGHLIDAIEMWTSAALAATKGE